MTLCAHRTQALERYRKTGTPLKCKQCTSAQEAKERQEAAAKSSASTNKTIAGPIICASCKQSLPGSDYNRNQLAKKNGRCRACVEKSLLEEENSSKMSKQKLLDDVRQKVKEAESKGDVKEKLKYESQLSALEAEHVTGLKPIVMGRGKGSWRGRGRGR